MNAATQTPGPHLYRINGEGFFTHAEILEEGLTPSARALLATWIEAGASGQLDLSDLGLPFVLTQGGTL